MIGTMAAAWASVNGHEFVVTFWGSERMDLKYDTFLLDMMNQQNYEETMNSKCKS
jgi:hypothetical protein